jgi:hypothetical protein
MPSPGRAPNPVNKAVKLHSCYRPWRSGQVVNIFDIRMC